MKRILIAGLCGFSVIAGFSACGASSSRDGLELLGCPADNGTIGTAQLTPAQECMANAVGVETAPPTQYTVIPHRSLDGCDVAVILTSAEGIALYRSGGDAVAVDPTETIGFKTTPNCVSRLEARLAIAEKRAPG